jgi:sterol desaturase/sphingolipid hydroxylase (fatty acid hydroxylase superfamily)
MEKYIDILLNSYTGYFNYLINQILYLNWDNYFYGLLAITCCLMLEIAFPWRKNKPFFIKDFGSIYFICFSIFSYWIWSLSSRYLMYRNSWSMIFYPFLSQLASIQLFLHIWITKPIALLLFFFIKRFYSVERSSIVTYDSLLWNIHKTHHSVKEMGFAAHFRYNWMEPIVYKSILYVPIILIGGVNLQDVFIVHFITIAMVIWTTLIWVGTMVLKYIFNNPKMHIWHHSKKLPNKYGVNFEFH